MASLLVKRLVGKAIIVVFLVGILLLESGSRAQAQTPGPLVMSDSSPDYTLNAALEYYEDADQSLKINDVSQADFSGHFAHGSGEALNFGLTDSAIWVKVRLLNQTSETVAWRMGVEDAMLGLVEMYAPAADGSGWQRQEAGFLLPANQRTYSHPHLIFPVSLPVGSEQTFYLRLTSPLAIRFSLVLWTANYLEQNNAQLFAGMGIFYGILFAVCGYHLLAFLLTRKRTYLLLFIVLFTYTLSVATVDGFAYRYLFPYWAHPYTRTGFSVVSILAMIWFISDFLELRVHFPRLNRGLKALGVVLTAALLLSPFISKADVLIYWMAILIPTFFLVCAFLVWQRGVSYAIYYFIGAIGPVINAVLRNINGLAIIGHFNFIDWLIDWGYYLSSLWWVAFLMLAFTKQNHQEKQELRRVENSWREANERFRMLYENSPMGIAMLDPHWNIERANPAFSELLGYTGDELNQGSYLELVYHQDRQQAAALHEELTSGKIFFYEKEARFMCKDGGLVWCVCSVYSLRSEEGALQYIFVIANDITRRKEYEQDLKQYGENLEGLVAARTSDLEHNQQRLTNLNQSIGSISSAGLDFERLYHAIWKETQRLVKVDAFSISLVVHEAGQVEDVFLIDEHGQQPGERYALQDSFVSEMINNRAGFVVTDFPSLPDDQWRGFWFGSHANVRSGMAIALIGSQAAIGLLTVQSYQPAAYSAGDLSILEAFAAHVSIALENLHLHQHAQQAVILEERQRLARELHDSVTQMLYSIALLSNGWSLQASQNRLENPSKSFNQLEGLSLQALKEMRLLIHQLRSPLLDELGLVKALLRRLETVEQSANVITDLTVEGELPKLHPAVEADIYAIVQEALNNALRHAHASHTTIEVVASEEQVCFSVHDDGVGFDPAKITSGMGSRTIRERAKAIHAQLDVQSQLGQGTTVTLSIAI